MKEFPELINPKNKSKFSYFRHEKILRNLRKEIAWHILEGIESRYYDLDDFSTRYLISKEDLKNMTDKIILELQNIGWKCGLTYGDTALFIYSTENPPSTFYQDGLI